MLLVLDDKKTSVGQRVWEDILQPTDFAGQMIEIAFGIRWRPRRRPSWHPTMGDQRVVAQLHAPTG